LKNIQHTLDVGKIYKKDINSVQFRVESLKELLVVIDHFEKYPLLTKKRVDFELFKLAINLIKNKEHLTEEGLNKLVSIKASLNKGITDKLKDIFLSSISIIKPNIDKNSIQDIE
jgi:hypothetical protein